MEISRLKGETSYKCVIDFIKSQFAKYGKPGEVINYNGPEFVSSKFETSSTEYKFTHATSSPHYPQSNSMAVGAVQTIKNLLKKSKRDNKIPICHN